MKDHPSHKTRYSDSSIYDEVCIYCEATDGRGDNGLKVPCPRSPYMNELEWLTCTDPERMLDYLGVSNSGTMAPYEVASDRKLRLLACAGARLNLYENELSYVEAAERFVDGINTIEEMVNVGTKWCVTLPNVYDALDGVVDHEIDRGQGAILCSLIRDIIGYPDRHVTREGHEVYYGDGTHGQDWWVTSQVVALAQAAYDERMNDGTLDNERLAVLSDALEEAGCTRDEILSHLRSSGPHVRGCWVVDTLLGLK